MDKGYRYNAVINKIINGYCEVDVRDKIYVTEREFSIHVAVAIPKKIARFEWLLEKITETGVDKITPLICHHSERVRVNMERLNKILISAMKQSQRAKLPLLSEAVNINHFIVSQNAKSAFIALCNSEAPSELKHLKEVYPRGNDATIIIGPEGGFTSDEINTALANSFEPVSFSHFRLRTETAALLACQIINLQNQ